MDLNTYISALQSDHVKRQQLLHTIKNMVLNRDRKVYILIGFGKSTLVQLIETAFPDKTQSYNLNERSGEYEHGLTMDLASFVKADPILGIVGYDEENSEETSFENARKAVTYTRDYRGFWESPKTFRPNFNILLVCYDLPRQITRQTEPTTQPLISASTWYNQLFNRLSDWWNGEQQTSVDLIKPHDFPFSYYISPKDYEIINCELDPTTQITSLDVRTLAQDFRKCILELSD